MCGIIGCFSTRGSLDQGFPYSRLVNLLQHRGPDDGAFWLDERAFLGHRRLSIIDIAGGSQPMASEDGRFVLVFNGEIYNYVELREELIAAGYAFQTNSDTEVLLKGCLQWKEEVLTKLVGMFAFAIYDRVLQELFLARDRFGEKPLFVLKDKQFLAFSSEIKPLCALPNFDRQLDIDILYAYLCLNYVPGEKTLLKNMYRIPPGGWLRVGRNFEQTGSYWRPPRSLRARRLDRNDVFLEFRKKFDRAVNLCLYSDLPVGIFLSGGIDSSLIAESAARQGKLNNAFCLDFEEASFSEYDKARLVSERLNIPLHRVVLKKEDLRFFMDIVDHADDPFADSSCLPYWVLSHYASQHNKVVLGGDGGDEIFGGYLTYPASLFHESVMTRLPGIARKLLAASSRRITTAESKVSRSYQLMRFLRSADESTWRSHVSWNGGWSFNEAEDLLSEPFSPVRGFKPYDNISKDIFKVSRLNYFQQVDLCGYLPNDILAKSDRMSMAHGLEVRAPFLNHELAEWALALPDHFKIKGRTLKYILRGAARDIYGAKLADAPKKGFSIPIHAWTRGPMREMVNDYLSIQRLSGTGIFNAAKVRALVDQHQAGTRSLGYEIWGLLVFMMWFERRVQTITGLPEQGVPRVEFPLKN
jgi:asparagine synthase (glutamine-hydrolysing)